MAQAVIADAALLAQADSDGLVRASDDGFAITERAARSRAPLLHTSTLIWPAPRRATRRRYDESGDQRRHLLPAVDQGRERAWVEDRGK